MRPGFFFINIIIILGLIFLAYFGYTGYLDDKIKQELAQTNPPAKQSGDKPPAEEAAPPAKQTEIKKSGAETAPAPVKAAPAAEKKGYYKNNTYFYEISFPENWPIKIRSAENVSLGTVPPRSGQGAIAIEVSPSGADNEIEQVQAEAKKYPGMISITEEPITLAGISGDKIIMENLLAKSSSINILLKKFDLNYTIKYSEESPEFTAQAEKALTTFKFTK